jgi:fucose permease
MTDPGGVRTGLLGAIACAGMFVFGVVMALLGAVMPVLSERLALGLADVGSIFLAANAAMLVASVVVGPLMDRLGMKAPLVAGAALVAAALGLVAVAGDFAALVAAVALLGLGGGALNAGTNTLVADLHDDPERKAAALNVLGVFFGFGALMLPFSVGALLSHVGLGALLAGGAALCAITAAAAAVPRFPPPKQAHGWPLRELGRFIGVPLVLALGFLLFFESGNEFLLGGYFSTFLTQELKVPVATASFLLAAYWGAIMASRVFLSRLLLHLPPTTIVLGGGVLAAAGALCVSAAAGPAFAVAGILLTGFALAGIFPTVLGIAGAAFKDHSGTVFGILFTIALTGGMTIPWLAGHLAAAAGLRAVFVLAAGNFLAVAALAAISRRVPRV